MMSPYARHIVVVALGAVNRCSFPKKTGSGMPIVYNIEYHRSLVGPCQPAGDFKTWDVSKMKYTLLLLTLVFASCSQTGVRTDQYAWSVGDDAELLNAAIKQYDTWYAFITEEPGRTLSACSAKSINIQVAPSGRKIRMTFADKSEKILEIDEFDLTFSVKLFAGGETDDPSTGWGANGLITLSKSDIQ
ncbi:MAG: hypothetical protein QGG25_16025 [Phycisphaerae bacterium]|nr:hypothetical protein [Phycisphaerae bacterium]